MTGYDKYKVPVVTGLLIALIAGTAIDWVDEKVERAKIQQRLEAIEQRIERIVDYISRVEDNQEDLEDEIR